MSCEFTEDDFRSIIEQTLPDTAVKVRIISAELRDCDEVLGFLGEYQRLLLTVENGVDGHRQTFHYFIKRMPQRNVVKREVIEGFGIFEKEAKLYEQLFTALGGTSGPSKWRPVCYLTRNDRLVFEDLCQQGFYHVPHGIEFGRSHIRCVLRTLAIMHASSIGFEVNSLHGETIGEVFKDLLRETMVVGRNRFFQTGLKALRMIILLMPQFAEFHHKIRKNFAEIVQPLLKMSETSKYHRNVLTHRDLWSNNLLFKVDLSSSNRHLRCILIDFQMCRYNPPAIDVLLTIFLNTTRRNRDAFFEEYLRFYHQRLIAELRSHCVDPSVLPWTKFRESCSNLEFFTILMWSIYAPLINLSPGTLNRMEAADPARYDRICNENRVAFILQQFQRDTRYRDSVLECFQEFLHKIVK